MDAQRRMLGGKTKGEYKRSCELKECGAEVEMTGQIAGVVLCGGKSSRMGYPKAWLPFGDEVLLTRVIRILREVVDPVVAVAAPEQVLPDLPAEVLVTRDAAEGRGPLQGLLAGLTALPEHVTAAYVTSCDVPLLTAAWVQYLLDELGDHQIVVPVEDRFAHPLAAVYHRDVVPIVRELLERDRLRPAFLFDQVRTRRIAVETLRTVDPELHALRNLNHPDEYRAAAALAGVTIPAEVQAALG